jgi:uncharacterized protein DUF4238
MRKHPAGVGYERDLYTVANVDKAISTYLEGTFFKITDNLASVALAIIEGGQSQWSTFDVETRSAWTRFIISLLYRNPEQIKRLIEIVSRFIELTKPNYEREYEKLVDADRSFDDFWRERVSTIIAKSWIRLTQTTIDSRLVGAHFNSLVWRVTDLKSTHTLLTGDRPIIMTNGMSMPNSHLAIPIGPRRLFTASPTSEIADNLRCQKGDEVARLVNERIIRQARRFCIGANEAHRPLFTKYFGEGLPSSPVDTFPIPTAEEMLQTGARLSGIGPDARPSVIVLGRK